MFKFRWFYTLIPCSIVCGSVNEPIRWEWANGYRNDTLHWHLKKPDDKRALCYTERARDLQFWENALTVRAIHRDITVFARGSFGAFGKGSLKQKYSNLNFTSENPIFSWKPTSWNFDGWGYFGYSVDLTSDRTYHVILIPMAGFGVNVEQLDIDGRHSLTGLVAISDQSFSMTSALPGKERMCWYGPLVGGLFIIQPGGRLHFEAGYAYHWLHLRLRSIRQTGIALYSPNGDLISESEQSKKLKVKDGGNLAHTEWGRIDYLLSKSWRIGLEGQVQYFSSRMLDAEMKDKSTSKHVSQKFKARWTAISGVFIVARTF